MNKHNSSEEVMINNVLKISCMEEAQKNMTSLLQLIKRDLRQLKQMRSTESNENYQVNVESSENQEFN